MIWAWRPERALKIKEEAGLQCQLTAFDSFVYRQVLADGLSEYEFDHVFIGFWDEAEAGALSLA
jgi:hypothetical protein